MVSKKKVAKQPVYDFTVENNHNFYANDVLVHNCFILVDEAQNLTRKGIRLILTRIAEGSIMVLNGDSDQVDLKNPDNSGFSWAVDRLSGKNSRIGIVKLDKSDVQRHPLITSIIENLY